MNDLNVSKKTILIVDDMPINIQVLARGLNSDYHIKIATDGEKAIEIGMSENPPDLILLDIMMPGMDGYEVCHTLKKNPKTHNIPIIFVTAKGEVEDETKGLELGAADYIIKPFHMPIVKARVNTHIDLKRKSDMLEIMLDMDALTGIANRRHFDKMLGSEWNRAKRSGLPVSLIILDIDYFKKFNDNYGHPAGDVCLKLVAQTLNKCVRRSGEIVARYGGEEFAVILPSVNHNDALKLAEKLRSHIESLKIIHAYSNIADCITISLGAATTVPKDGLEPAELINTADKMLYEAKNHGRNQLKGEAL
ncbi:MAG: diguanylate cyclase [Desulfobacterium sp.]|nr:diguanylate cyclase [Desulfobacterium sp.]MBU3950281.1 diguanylate cyclase [Pseudomonadota bacterium]MBU4010327.1 diguanylate cyclase [Pseudomonadota bacterium]MBU4037710.1 diguanylate cyclase [Pseudomonadota bacterium]